MKSMSLGWLRWSQQAESRFLRYAVAVLVGGAVLWAGVKWWGWTLDSIGKVSPLLTFAVAIIAARISWNFGRIQTNIARTQSQTAMDASRTARNKLRLELFERRLEIYDLITTHMQSASSPDRWKTDSSPYFQAVSVAKWLFDETVTDWIFEELQTAVRKIATAQAACEGIDVGPERAKKVLAVLEATYEFQRQYARRDEVFATFLHLKDD